MGTAWLWARESVHHSAGVWEESRCSRGARGRPSGGLTKPRCRLPASLGGLGTGKLVSWDMKGHFIRLAK